MPVSEPAPNRGDADDWLRSVERAEAAALREEWSRLLASQPFREEIDKVLRKPLEAVIRDVLKEPQVAAGLRQPLLEGLKAEVLNGELATTLTQVIRQQTTAAVSAALRDTPVTLGGAQLGDLREAATAAVRRAVTDAVRAAATDEVPKRVRQFRAELLTELESSLRRAVSTSEALFPEPVAERILAAVSDYVRDITRQVVDSDSASGGADETSAPVAVAFRVRRKGPGGWVTYAAGAAVVLLVIAGSFWLGRWTTAVPRSEGTAPQAQLTNAREDAPEPTPSADTIRQQELTRMWTAYQASLDPTKIIDDLKCASVQLANARGASYPDVLSVLRNCPALDQPPDVRTPSAIVAVAQVALRSPRGGTCAQLSVTADAFPGSNTDAALRAHLQCRRFTAPPVVVLAHYMAFGLSELATAP